jgi:hypothetical protein
MARRKDSGRALTSEAAAARLCIAVRDLPDLGRAWTGRDVTEAQQSRPEWLTTARRALAAAKAEMERERQQRLAVVAARRAHFTWPTISDKDAGFATEFARANLLTYLYDALDAPAADTEVWDSGYDVSTHAHRVQETNRERARRGVSLSGRNEQWCREHGLYREPGTLGDLFDAPTGNTVATFVSGAGLAAESWGEAWHDRWSLEGLELASVLADLALAGDTDALEVIAGTALADVDAEPGLTGADIPDDVLSLAAEALREWCERACPVFDPDEVVDMNAPLSALPQMLLATRHDWDRTERLALLIAGLDPVERLSLARH